MAQTPQVWHACPTSPHMAVSLDMGRWQEGGAWKLVRSPSCEAQAVPWCDKPAGTRPWTEAPER
eukprot:9135598-Prorocentrum_lima.AAC.1